MSDKPSHDEAIQFRVVVSVDMQGYGRTVSGFDPAGVQDVQERIKAFVLAGCEGAAVSLEDVLWNWTGDGSLLAFKDAAKADTFARAFLQASADWNRNRQRLIDRRYFHFRIGIDADFVLINETGLCGDTVVKAVRLQGAAGPGEMLTSPFVHRLLSPSRRQNYGPREVVRGKKGEGLYEAHRQQVAVPDRDSGLDFVEAGPPTHGLFVVPPTRHDASRADAIFETYVQPACQLAGFHVERAETKQNATEQDAFVTPATLQALRTQPLVLAYLGTPCPEWNVALIFALGSRLAAGLPVVFLRETENAHDNPTLPFDLREHRVVDLPSATPDSVTIEQIRNELATGIADAAKTAVPWDSPHPVTTLDFNFASQKSIITDASKEAGRLFVMENKMVGAKVSDLIASLEERMPPEQYRAFSEEQARLMTILRNPLPSAEVRVPVATIPVVFNQHPLEEYRGRAYLPIIVGHSKISNVLRLRVLYLDVTSTISQHRGYFVCHLSDSPRLANLPSPDNAP